MLNKFKFVHPGQAPTRPGPTDKPHNYMNKHIVFRIGVFLPRANPFVVRAGPHSMSASLQYADTRNEKLLLSRQTRQRQELTQIPATQNWRNVGQ